MNKGYKICYMNNETKCYYDAIPNCKGEYVVFTNLSGGKDFKLNKYFYRTSKIEGDVMYIL